MGNDIGNVIDKRKVRGKLRVFFGVYADAVILGRRRKLNRLASKATEFISPILDPYT